MKEEEGSGADDGGGGEDGGGESGSDDTLDVKKFVLSIVTDFNLDGVTYAK